MTAEDRFTGRRPCDCPYRMVDGERCCCGLLAEITKVDPNRLSDIPEGACEACCESFAPNARDLNPVVASLLYQFVESEMPVSCGAGRDRQEELLAFAQSQLPTVLPSEDDCAGNRATDSQGSFDQQELAKRIPIPPKRCGSPVRWAVGMTTCHRRLSTVTDSVNSLLQCGWSSDEFTLFLDGPVELGSEHQTLHAIELDGPSGAWTAWCRAFELLFEDAGDADALMLVQDDAYFAPAPEMRAYLEAAFWPASDNCIVSLYTSSDYSRDREPGWHLIEEPWTLGAVAWVFPRRVAVELLDSIRDGQLETVAGEAGIDTRVGAWAWSRGISFWYPIPSLVQHIGDVSTVWSTSRAVGLRRASRFLSDE